MLDVNIVENYDECKSLAKKLGLHISHGQNSFFLEPTENKSDITWGTHFQKSFATVAELHSFLCGVKMAFENPDAKAKWIKSQG